MSRPVFPLNDSRRRKLVLGLEHRLSDHRAEMESMSTELSRRLQELEAEFTSTSERLKLRRQSESDEATTQWDQDREAIWSRRDRVALTSLRSEARRKKEIDEAYHRELQRETEQHKQAREKLDHQYEELKPRPARILERYVESLRAHQATAAETLEAYVSLMAARSVNVVGETASAPAEFSKPTSAAEAVEEIMSQLQSMKATLETVRSRFIVRFAGSVFPWLLGLVPGIFVGVGSWLGLREQPAVAVGATLGTLFLGPIAFVFSLMPSVKRTLRQGYPNQLDGVERIAWLAKVGQAKAELQCRQDEARLLREYQERLNHQDREHEAKRKQMAEQLERDQLANHDAHIGTRRRAGTDSTTSIDRLDGQWLPKLDQLATSHRSRKSDAEQDYLAKKSDVDRRIGELKRNLEYRVRIGTDRATAWLKKQLEAKQRRFPSWDHEQWRQGGWSRFSDEAATKLPVGECEVRIADEFDTPMPVEFDWLKQGSLIIEADARHRDQARDLVRSMLTRAFTTLPMGRLNCTIVDPEGLGRDYSWLMPLADADHRLVGHRVWTQSSQIAEQLSMLAYQTEDIIQQRLRDRYSNIIEYNAEAGPMAEPLRLLVWANFPFGLEEVSWRALCSILASGGRCGIGVLMTIDPNHAWPPFADRHKLRTAGLRLSIGEDVQIEDDTLKRYTLKLDSPPSNELLQTIVEHCAQAAIDSSKIEVPFETIRVDEEAFAGGRSDNGLAIPLGVAGVGRTTSLRLGQGTAQHVLIAGKTGAGKSSLLHTLITSAALKYPPDQLRMVLLDFKKGVEFQVYAQARLPHAEIIGIESRREFGLSTLEYLDRVMQRRGELFREAGVQDVPGWVRTRPAEAMPRVLVVVDEFQEMFIEDDKLSQQASMLLDRVVRQGRSFGIHVVLASQTIGGSYSLPRTTLAQMAVRIALQCDAADAMMILSEDNMAATRLRHSGQAVYNDAGGRVESNQPFQVAYLRSSLQQDELARIQVGPRPNDPSTDLLGRQIIFEGHKPAVWSTDDVRRGLRMQPTAEAGSLRLVLGESLSIEPTVTRCLTRQAGRNVVIVGSDQELAANLISTVVRGWMVEHEVDLPQTVFFDGCRIEDVKMAELKHWLRRLHQSDKPSTAVEIVEPRGIDEAVAKLHAELTKRMEEPNQSHPTTISIIANLGRLRELRKSEEFSFAAKASDQPATDEAFSKLLREGPSVGMFTLCWVDSWGTLSRFVPRQGLRDIEIRILMQLSANDSNQLIDSSAANKLESHAMIYFDEIDGKIAKFRPYRLD